MFKSALKPNLHGWLILDKPKGLTSTQAIGKARRLLNGNKVGHGGTLDPLATGLLPLAFGEATKLIPYVMDGEKDYEFTIRWGEARTTDDAEGNITTTSAVRPSADAVRAALPRFTGTISQTPPAFSAIKVQGERAYDIARDGGEVELAPRDVIIRTLELTDTPNADHTAFRMTCGKGTYVRSLARDLAAALGTCGHVSALRRTRVGGFTLDAAVTLGKLEEMGKAGEAQTALQPLRAATSSMATLTLTAAEAQRLRLGQGVLIRPQQLDMMGSGPVFAEHEGVPVAVVEAKFGEFKVLRGFHF